MTEFIYFLFGVFCALVFRSFATRSKVYYLQNEGMWLPISDLPEDIIKEERWDEILISDGEKVGHYWTLSYNCDGELVMGYPKRTVKYWRPVNLPPMQGS